MSILTGPARPGQSSRPGQVSLERDHPSSGAQGRRLPLDLGKGIGSEGEREGETTGEGGERATVGRGSLTLQHATIWSSTSWMAESSDVGRWH